MGFFDRLKEPVFLKDNSNAQQELSQLKELRSSASGVGWKFVSKRYFIPNR